LRDAGAPFDDSARNSRVIEDNCEHATKRPRLSLFSPRNETALPFNDNGETDNEYLQIDVEVVSSRFVSSSIVSPSGKDAFTLRIPHIPSLSEAVAVTSPSAMGDVHIKEEGDNEWEVGMKKLRMMVAENTTDVEADGGMRRRREKKERRERRGKVLIRI